MDKSSLVTLQLRTEVRYERKDYYARYVQTNDWRRLARDRRRAPDRRSGSHSQDPRRLPARDIQLTSAGRRGPRNLRDRFPGPHVLSKVQRGVDAASDGSG